MACSQLHFLGHQEVQLLCCVVGLGTSDVKVISEEDGNLRSQSPRGFWLCGWWWRAWQDASLSLGYLLWKQTRSWCLLPGVLTRIKISCFHEALGIVVVF